MSRTGGGFSFSCKKCYYKHILTKGNPHNGIRVPCAQDSNLIAEYSESDFEPFYGVMDWNMIFNSVEEVKN